MIANRIIFVKELLAAVDASMTRVKNRPMATYTLTRYSSCTVLARILRSDPTAASLVADPAMLSDSGRAAFVAKSDELLKTVVVDLNYESGSVDFDYKSVLKARNSAATWPTRSLPVRRRMSPETKRSPLTVGCQAPEGKRVPGFADADRTRSSASFRHRRRHRTSAHGTRSDETGPAALSLRRFRPQTVPPLAGWVHRGRDMSPS